MKMLKAIVGTKGGNNNNRQGNCWSWNETS